MKYKINKGTFNKGFNLIEMDSVQLVMPDIYGL